MTDASEIADVVAGIIMSENVCQSLENYTLVTHTPNLSQDFSNYFARHGQVNRAKSW